MAGKWKLCPRCELNYIKEEEDYCDVCKAELKKGPQLIFAVDEEENDELEEMGDLCPKCHQNFLNPGEKICSKCALEAENEEKEIDPESDDSWKEFMDEEEPEEEEDSEEMLSLSKLVEEEGSELFDDEEEEEEIEAEPVDEPDDFETDIDEADFMQEDDEDEEDEEDDDFDDEKD